MEQNNQQVCGIFEELDEIESIEIVGFEDTIDIDVEGDHLFYANGVLTHNCAVDEIEFDHSHISGGLSKIQTADNVIGIFTNRAMREAGRYQIQYMKTRSSAGVGQSVELKFDQQSLRIRDMDEGSAPTPTISSLASGIKRTVTTTGTNHSSNNGTNTQHNSNAKPGGLASLRDQLARLNPERD